MCTQCIPKIDEEKVNEFAGQMIGHLNGAAIALMTSIGHRTGLFDVMAQMDYATSREIAENAGLNERYVREWLGTMTTGRIVEHEEVSNRYRLPAEHAALLTRAANSNNIGVTMQWVSVLGRVEDGIVECFKNGGGLPYEKFSRFHEVMAEQSHQTTVEPLNDMLLPLVDGLKAKLEAGIDVLDVGCGSGRALITLALRYPQSRFTGYDLCQEAVVAAQNYAKAEGVENVTFRQTDVSRFNDMEKYDLIFTFDAVHDQARPDVVLKNIFNALKPDGLYFMQDIAGSSSVSRNMEHMLAPFIYTISCMHCMTVSLAQGGAGLGAMWGHEKALEMLAEAGFTSVDIERLEHDILNNYYLVRK